MTAKTFRTWIATCAVSAELASSRAPTATKHEFLAAVDRAAAVLGNTRLVCRTSYVHPAVERTWFGGTLVPTWRAGPRRPTAGLTTAERRTIHLLEAADPPVSPRRPVPAER